VPKTRTVHIAAGQAVVKRGELVTPELQASVARMWRGADPQPSWPSYAATAALVGMALALFVAFARRHLHHFRHRPRDAGLLAVILLVHAAVLRAHIAALPFLAEAGVPQLSDLALVALPHALGPALATLFMRPFTAAPFALLCAVVSALMVHNAPLSAEASALMPLVAVLALVVGLAGVQAARKFRERADLASGTLLIASVSALSAWAAGLLASPLVDLEGRWLWLMGLGAASGLLTYLLLAALTPLLEMAFNRLTDIKLVELASMNHPALRLLATEAPGTFTHSVMVGNLAQAAADAIGANGLLARVGAYYHDLGKTRAPRYFAENQVGDNPHDRLKPHLSALVIRSHVKDGIKILQEFGLPDEIIDFVPQHHGTSLIAHFFHRAQREADDGDEVQEADFRYPGPKPQRKETALLMLADAVEAAAKALPEPNAVRIQALVKRIIAAKTEDGQFDECDLTLRELALVEAAFVKSLVGMHHARPVYLPAAQPSTGQPSVAPSAAALVAPRDRDVRELARETMRDPALTLVQTQPLADASRVAQGWDSAPSGAPAPESPTAVVAHTSRRG
jgi:putative nucleotidyltransferase with HDIG domain